MDVDDIPDDCALTVYPSLRCCGSGEGLPLREWLTWRWPQEDRFTTLEGKLVVEKMRASGEYSEEALSTLEEQWTSMPRSRLLSPNAIVILIIYYLTFKVLVLMAVIIIAAGGVGVWLDEVRPFVSPILHHLNGYGWWYMFLLWVHVICGFCVFIWIVPLVSKKGSDLHILGGRLFVMLWIPNIFAAVVMGTALALSRGPYPGTDFNQRTSQHYWGSFDIWVALIQVLQIANIGEAMSHGLAAFQFRSKISMPPYIHKLLLLSSTASLALAAMILLFFFFLRFVNQVQLPNDWWIFYYFIVMPIESINPLLNFVRMWRLGEVWSASRSVLISHVRNMIMATHITCFIFGEVVIYKMVYAWNLNLLLGMSAWMSSAVIFWSIFLYFYKRRAIMPGTPARTPAPWANSCTLILMVGVVVVFTIYAYYSPHVQQTVEPLTLPVCPNPPVRPHSKQCTSFEQMRSRSMNANSVFLFVLPVLVAAFYSGAAVLYRRQRNRRVELSGHKQMALVDHELPGSLVTSGCNVHEAMRSSA